MKKKTTPKKAKVYKSKEYKKFIKRTRLNRFLISLGRWGVLVLVLGLWELSAQLNWVDPYITSSPLRAAKTIIAWVKDGSIWLHTWTTLYETLLAFAISIGLGSLIAILLYLFTPIRKIFDPYLVVLNSLPKVALGPLLIVWVGAGTKAIVLMGILICIVITTLNMLQSFVAVPQEKILLLKTMGANRFQILFKLVLPHSLPDFISVLKINVGMAMVGTIMGEYLVSQAGLGYIINYGGLVFNLDTVMAGIIVLCVLASLMYFSVAALETYVHKKRGIQ